MLSLNFIRENQQVVERAIADKNVSLDLGALLALDTAVRSMKGEVDELRRQRNAISDSFKTADPADRPTLGAKAKEFGARAAAIETELAENSAALDALMLRLPNIPWAGAPVGPDESANVVVRTEGRLPEFDFEPRDHVALLEMNDWAELGRITQVSGSRTYCLKGRLALLEQALMFWAQQRLAGEGFSLMTVPALARPHAFVATGHFPGHEEEAYEIPKDDLYLAGTGEIALTSLHSGEILEADKLPILYAGYSPCFRREAGSAGRDVRGLLRVHQFYKLEQYVICEDDDAVSAEWHGRLLANAEGLLRDLEIPYQVIEASTGDMGLGKFRMNDIESWVPSLGKYRETHSCSTLHDWQARRANLRWRDGDRKVRFVHTLNNTALASPRILVPLLENHQLADGRVRLPKALQGLMGGEYL
ncbi:serine--tRNA ligase [Sphingosinicella rhizophila]|uniref:Serine--tRNA ligase n=1 Tax=Sphingosinicella rhizophila TaxID=3050082 RepID=A0ABU3Q7M6_9SPHN|nr:serine--tRNA ligase [Sphingosinicella sp. GR2756]MDT9599322.1 serine--tRNA ligase [Sphingosinicella sp. GR2756]